MINPQGGHFHFTIKDKNGNVKDKFTRKNGVTAWAQELMLTCALATSSWYVGLIRTFDDEDPWIRTPPFDPIVLNALGWQEYERYTGDRKAWDFTIDVNEATADPVQFIGFNEAMQEMGGAFLASTATKGAGYDTVFAFSTGGGIVTLDDIVEVEYTVTV